MKNNILKANITEEKNEIHDNILDIFGNEFKFDHEKGLAELLKNSIDAYIRKNISDNGQYVIFRFSDCNGLLFECIDFVGMTENDIIKAFKKWGDPTASKRGSKKTTFGGHGNGGKFYMRQMFESSYIITYADEYLNIYGFSKNKKYGFDDKYRNFKISPLEAMKMANINNLPTVSSKLYNQIIKGETGFTVIRGNKPKGIKHKINIGSIIQKFKNHPQTYNILSRINASVIYNDKIFIEELKPEEIKPMTGFEEIKDIVIPKKLNFIDDGEEVEIELANDLYKQGSLLLKTSEFAISNNSKF